MKRLGIIHLRLARALPPGLVEEIRESKINTRDSASVALYCRVNVENDVALYLHLEESGPGNQASDLGVRLAAGLREFGMVEHTVCAEESADPGETE
jgi:hypothetical protein